MATLRSWFDGAKDFDVFDPDQDELLGRAREYLRQYPGAVKLEIELDDGLVLNTEEIIAILVVRADELRHNPRQR